MNCIIKGASATVPLSQPLQLTLATPARRNPSSSAGEAETSITRPRINGPRSTTVTITTRPLSTLAPRTCLPNGRGLLAAIIPLCYGMVQ